MFAPWCKLGMDAALLAFEPQVVIGLRMAKLASGALGALAEMPPRSTRRCPPPARPRCWWLRRFDAERRRWLPPARCTHIPSPAVGAALKPFGVW